MAEADHDLEVGAGAVDGPSEATLSPSSASPVSRSRRIPDRASVLGPKAKRSNSTHRLARIIHTYTSMFSLIVVLFFAVTGITLNHPSWSLGGPSRTTAKGVLPANWKNGAGDVDWFEVSEYLRSTHQLRGSVADKRADDSGASISFKGPGYGADAFINPADGSYDLAVEAQGALGVMNDLHKGRDSRSSWRWLIDVVGGFVVLISLTGLLMQFFLRRRRRAAFSSAFIGALICVALAWLALR